MSLMFGGNSNWFTEQFKLICWAISMNLLRNFNEFAEECAFCSVAKWWWLAGYAAFERWLENGCFMPCCVMWGQKVVERRWKPMHHRRTREMPCSRKLVGGCSPTTRAATGTNVVAAPYRWWLYCVSAFYFTSQMSLVSSSSAKLWYFFCFDTSSSCTCTDSS